MGYYEDNRFGFLNANTDPDVRDAGLEFIIEAAKAQGMNITDEAMANLRNALTLGSKGVDSRKNTVPNAMEVALRLAGNNQDLPFMFAFNNFSGINEPVLFRARQAGGTDRVVLPIPPETFSIQSENSSEEVTSVLGLTYSHAGPIAMAEMNIEGVFPQITPTLPSYVPQYVDTYGWFAPDVLCAKFITAMNAGQPIEFTVTDPKTQTVVMPTRVVVVTSFEWEVRSGHGQDRFYNMTLKEWIPQQISIGGFQPGASKVVTLPKKMTLGNIADLSFRPKFATAKDRNRWREIYNLNKTKLDAFVRGVHAGTVNPNTGAKVKKGSFVLSAAAKRRYKVGPLLPLPAKMALNVPPGADINAIQKKVS